MNKTRNFITIFIVFNFFSLIVYSQTNYYVSSNGSNSNNGLSETSPFLTINKGISQVSAGGTVFVMNGTYQNSGYGTVDVSTNTNMNNQHVVTINKSGTEGAYITLKNYPNHSPKIQFDGRGGIVISNDMNYIIIEGFEVEGASASITYDIALADRAYKVLAAFDQNDNINYTNSYFQEREFGEDMGLIIMLLSEITRFTTFLAQGFVLMILIILP